MLVPSCKELAVCANCDTPSAAEARAAVHVYAMLILPIMTAFISLQSIPRTTRAIYQTLSAIRSRGWCSSSSRNVNGIEVIKMNEFYDKLAQGLQEAIAYERGEIKARKVTYHITPIRQYNNLQIRAIRNHAGMSQSVFADYIGVSKKTVEAWEKGTNHPTGSACRLISLLEDDKIDILPFIRRDECKEG